MAEERTKPAAQESEKAKEPKQAAEDEPTFAVEDLIEGARGFFGVSPHLAAGAFSKGNRKTFTMAEAQRRVEQFAKREID